MIAALRSMAGKNRDFAGVAQILEKLAAQGVAEASTGLAELYGDWGQAERLIRDAVALTHHFGAGTTTVGAPPAALPPASAIPPLPDPVPLNNSGRLRKASGVGA